MPLSGFIYKYFISPIQVEQGYNLINTITYAIIAFVLLYALLHLFKRLKIRINFPFFIALAPFIFLGSYMRTMVDLQVFRRTFYTVSPGVYFVITIFFLMALFAGYFIQDKHEIAWWKPTFIIGVLLALFNVLETSNKTGIENLNWLILIVLSWLFGSLGLYYILKYLKQSWGLLKLNFSALSAQLFDAINTAVILNFIGGVEKHPVPRFFIEKAGTAFAFIPLKLTVILPAVYIIHTRVEDKDFRNLLVLAIAILGTAQGLRNLLTLVLS